MNKFTIEQYEVIQDVTNKLVKKFSNLSLTDVEEAVVKAAIYLTKKKTVSIGNFKRTLMWKARNLALNIYRKDKLIYTALQESILYSPHEHVYPPADVILERQEFYASILDRLLQLSKTEQNILYLYLYGHTISSTASILKLNRNRTAIIRNNLFAKLREGLEDYEVY